MLLIGAALNGEAQQATVPAPPSFVTWDAKMKDIGVVRKGEKRTLHFELTNTSDSVIQIDLVDACSCTTTDYPRGIIGVGEKARIEAVFDSSEKDQGETIDVNVLFRQTDTHGQPRLEVVRYKFELEKG